MKFYLGTSNPYKVQEIGAILSATGCTFEVTDPLDPEETESDFIGNALLKAKVYAQYTQGLTICEDSGLIVPTLKNLPGPWSARFYETIFDKNNQAIQYHKLNKTREEIDDLNNDKVLELMQKIEMPYRAAMFKIVLIVADPKNILFKAENSVHGWIAKEKKGNNGFGYDPIFIGSDTFGKTFAEIDTHRKNLKSHRRKVLQQFKFWLANQIKAERQ